MRQSKRSCFLVLRTNRVVVVFDLVQNVNSLRQKSFLITGNCHRSSGYHALTVSINSEGQCNEAVERLCIVELSTV